MKNLFLLSLTTMLAFFKISMAHDLEDYVNKGHVEILVEALKYTDAGMFEEAADEIKNTNNKNLLVLVKWLKLREGEGNFSEYTEFLKYYAHWPQTRLLKKFGELSGLNVSGIYHHTKGKKKISFNDYPELKKPMLPT